MSHVDLAAGEIEPIVAGVDMPHTVPIMYGTEGLTCGYAAGDRVAPEEYSYGFRFTGTFTRVTMDLFGELIPDTGVDRKIVMVQQ